MSFGMFLISCLLMWVPRSAMAEDEPKTSWAAVNTVTQPFGLSNPIFGAPTKLSLGLAAKRKVGAMPWVVEAGIGSSLTEFQPGVYAILGPSQKLTPAVSLGEKLTWRGSPRYGDHEAVQALGLSVGPIFPTRFGALGLSVGFSCTATEDPACGGSFSEVLVIAVGGS